MKYDDLPIFKGITSEAAAYLDAFDFQMERNHIVVSEDEMYFRKISLYSDYMEDYEKYMLNPTKEAKDKFNKAITDRAMKMASHADNSPLILVVKGIYGIRRSARNTPLISETQYANMLNLWRNSANTLKAYEDIHVSGWIFKEAPFYQLSKKLGKPLHRYILNAHLHPDLLKKLDEFTLKYNCSYKCPVSLESAYRRPDSIVIYTADERTAEQQKELGVIIKPYVRERGDHLLDGQKLADGLFTAPEKTVEDIKQLASTCARICPRLQKCLEAELAQKKGKLHPLSLGEFSVYQSIKDSASEFKKRQHTRMAMIKGICLNEKDKSILVCLNEANEIDFQVKDKNGKLTSSFVINRDSQIYVAQDMKTGEIFSNSPELKKRNYRELPSHVIERFKQRAKEATRIAQQKDCHRLPTGKGKNYS